MYHVLRFFFFNDTATTEIYTLSLHDALPIYPSGVRTRTSSYRPAVVQLSLLAAYWLASTELLQMALSPSTVMMWLPIRRSEEHTSELQSRQYLVCRLLLEKKKKNSRLVNNQ